MADLAQQASMATREVVQQLTGVLDGQCTVAQWMEYAPLVVRGHEGSIQHILTTFGEQSLVTKQALAHYLFYPHCLKAIGGA